MEEDLDQPPAIADILHFWFGQPPKPYEQRRRLWFGKHPDFDQAIRDRFQSLYQQADSYVSWQRTPTGCLALIVLLDQFPRNMFRDTAQSFATDAQALAVSKATIAQGFDQQLPPIQRFFIYLPLEHSEHLADQEQSIAHWQRLSQSNPEFADACDYALRHYAVIQRFGRFPHRNRILDRPSTPEELEFLKQPGSSF